MGISAQAFRTRIGYFNLTKIKKSKTMKPKMNKQGQCWAWPIKTLIIILMLSTTLVATHLLIKESNQNQKQNVLKMKNIEDDIFSKSAQHLNSHNLSWAKLGCSENKLQKIINGNRRAIGYKLAVWNCGRGLVQDGFSNKLSEIKQFIGSKKPHCFAIIESDFYSHISPINRFRKYTTDEIREKLKIDGYSIELPQTWATHGQARLICYVSNDIKYSRKIFKNNDHIPSITLEIGLGRATRTIVHYYYREWKNGVTGEGNTTTQLVHLKQHINQWEELVHTGRDFVALGDANLCAMSWNENDFRYKELSNQVQNFLVQENCSQLVNKFTRIQKVGNTLQKSCLDHVTTNTPEKCNVPEVFATGNSDHLPVMVTKYSREVKTQPKTIKKRNYKNFNVSNFLNDVQENVTNGSFVKIVNNQDIDEASALFSGVFGSILNRHAPLKVFQVRNNYSPSISPETKQMMEARDDLKREAADENCQEKFEAYKRLRNRVNDKLENDEAEHFKSKFYQENPSVSSLWRNANDYLNTSKRSFSNTPNIITHNGQTFTNPRDVANAINDTFLKKVKDLRTQVSDDPEIDPKVRLGEFLRKRSEPIPSFNLKKISISILRKILKKRKGNRSSGIDYIDGYSIKLAAPLIENILLHLVNLSIEKSKYPNLWKVNKVSPQFKKGDKTKGENWRPITDIVFVSKLAEAAVFDQVAEHFSSNKLWHPNHHGFRPHHSTATALCQLYDFWIRAAESKELSAALLLDLSAAFDVVDHKILLDKLELYNFSAETLSWFKSYLENRRQIVVVESKLSDPKDVGDQGVPQGSLLGPILFLIFYNDFPDVRVTGSSILYADDDTDNVSDPNPDILQQKIQQEANKSTSWVHDNKLVCSGGKTKLLVIGTRDLRNSKLVSQNKVIKINVAGHEVTESTSERLLGLIVNNTMTWEHQLYGNDEHKGLVTKLSQRAGLIRRLSFVMPKDKLIIMAEGIFFSLLNYCLEVFGNVWGIETYDETDRHSPAFRKDDNMRLQVLVNKVLRALTGLDYETPISVLSSRSGQLSVHQRTAVFTLTSVHKALKNQEPLYSHSLLHPDQDQVRTNCRRVECKLSISRGSFYYRGSRLYNQLPANLTSIPKLPAFKKSVKQWVRDNIPLLPP